MSREFAPTPNPTETSTVWKRSAIFLLISVLLHLPFLGGVGYLMRGGDVKIKKGKRVVQIRRVKSTKRSRLKRRQLIKKLFPKKKKPKKRKPKPRKLRGQVVDLTPTKDQRTPKDYKYLSQYNTRVKKQTVSRHQRLKYRRAARRLMKKSRGKRRAISKKRRRLKRRVKRTPQRRGKNQRKGNPRSQRRKSRRVASNQFRKLLVPIRKKRQKRNERKLKVDNKRGRYTLSKKQKELKGNNKSKKTRLTKRRKLARQEPSQKGSHKAQRAFPSLNALKPSLSTLSRIQGAPPPDYIKENKGEETLLNSKRWRFAAFFNRVKQLVAQHWNPGPAYRAHDPRGNIYGVKDRMTVVYVVLHKTGKLAHIRVKRSSGLRFLDDVAIKSFQKAQPFPNPPGALTAADGKIRFTFGFMLELSSKPKFLLFRR